MAILRNIVYKPNIFVSYVAQNNKLQFLTKLSVMPENFNGEKMCE